MSKKLISLLLLCCLLLSAFAASGEGESETAAPARMFTMAGYDGDSTSPSWESNLFFQRMQEKTGIGFTFAQEREYDAWTKKKTAYLDGSEALPDVLFKAALTPQEEAEGYANGKLVDLAPLLAEHAPNLSALLEANPEWRKAITLSDGAIVALPSIDLLRSQNAMWINQTWLERLSLDMPTDSESLTEVLRAFATQDPNRNGSADEVPFTFIGAWDLKFLSHAYGLIANDYNVYVNDKGVVEFMPLADNYRDFMAWLTAMYSEKLLDQQGFTQSDQMRTVSEEKDPVRYGVLMGPTPLYFLPLAHGQQYVVLSPLVYEGKQTYRDFAGPLIRGTFAITSACQDPGALLEWVDALYAEEGAVLAMAGLEGVEYDFNPSGTWFWVGDANNVTTMLQNATIANSSLTPWYSPVEFQLLYSDEKSAAMIKESAKLGELVTMPFPEHYILTDEETAYIAPIQMEIATYVDESLARFVTGEWPLDDEHWQAYVSGFEDMGVAAFVEFWQGIYERTK